MFPAAFVVCFLIEPAFFRWMSGLYYQQALFSVTPASSPSWSVSEFEAFPFFCTGRKMARAGTCIGNSAPLSSAMLAMFSSIVRNSRSARNSSSTHPVFAFFERVSAFRIVQHFQSSGNSVASTDNSSVRYAEKMELRLTSIQIFHARYVM